MNNQKGYSLVELLIVVMILGIIAAIAVPALVTSRQAANEASAVEGLRTIGSAEVAFAATRNQQYTNMASLVAGNYLDSRFSNSGYVTGYTYTTAADANVTGAPESGAPPNRFGVLAQPNASMGRYTYGIATDQVVRFESAATGTTFPTGVAAGDPIGKST